MRGRGSRPEGNLPGGAANGRTAGQAARGLLRPNPHHRPGGPQRLRLLIALDLPAAVRLGLDAWSREALTDPALRRIDASNLRMVLNFLGHRPEAEVDRVMAAIRQVCEDAPAPLIELRAPEPRPSRGRPRVLALPAHSPGAEIVQFGLRAVLADLGRDEPASRPFWPHVTVARVRPEGGGSRRPMRVRALPSGPLPAPLLEPFHAASVGLYRSDLHPRGARHTCLGKIELHELG